MVSSVEALPFPNLTIVILSIRPSVGLINRISYWEKLVAAVIVADGSHDEVGLEQSASHRKTTYLSLPGATYKERLGRAAELVSTEYVALVPDDELFLPEGIQATLQFLSEHPDYIGCSGQAVALHKCSRCLKPYDTPLYSRRQKLDLSNASGATRMWRHMSRYTIASYYSIMRATTWKQIWTALSDEEFNSLANQEIQFEISASLLGRLRVLSETMWVRNKILPSHHHSGEGTFDPTIRFEDWWKSRNFRFDKLRYVLQITRACQRGTPGTSLTEGFSYFTVKSGIDLYVAREIFEAWKRSLFAFPRWIIRVVLHRWRRRGGTDDVCTHALKLVETLGHEDIVLLMKS